MRKNYKIHAIAIVSICMLTTAIYAWLVPTPSTTEPEGNGDRGIEIYDATWGLNCNPAIAAAIQNPPPAPKLGASATPNSAPKKPLSLVADNNALIAVGNACNGKTACQLKATSEMLGVEPLEACFKHLDVRYRCFSYDRAWDVTTSQGKTLTIDCHATAAPPAKP